MSSGQAPADGPDSEREDLNAKAIECADSKTNGYAGCVVIAVRSRRASKVGYDVT
jgi:hypothetical protein